MILLFKISIYFSDTLIPHDKKTKGNFNYVSTDANFTNFTNSIRFTLR